MLSPWPAIDRYIAVYFTSMITTVQGDVYYRESRDFLEKSRVALLIRKHENDLQFTPTYLLIITWDDVPEYSLDNKVSIEERILFTFYLLELHIIIDWT